MQNMRISAITIMTKKHVALAAALVATAFAYADEKGSATTGGLAGSADRAIVRAQEDVLQAKQYVVQGDIAMRDKRYKDAYLAYMDALDKLPLGGAVGGRGSVVNKFSKASLAYAKELVADGRFNEAEKVAKTNLLPQYDPSNREMVAFLSHLEQPDYYNKTVTPEQGNERYRVVSLLAEAQGYFDVGRFDLASKRYEQVLLVDPYNNAARMGMERVNKERSTYYDAARNETRSRMLWQGSKAWERPLDKYSMVVGPRPEIVNERGNEKTVAKLNNIIIPRVNFRDTTVREAISFLSQQSRNLDTASGNGLKRGVNIVLKLPTGPTAAPAEEGAVESGNAETLITLSLSNVPLIEALRHVTDLANLKFKIEPYAVAIVPVSENTDDLFTKEYRVPPGFIPATAPDSSPIIAPGGGGGGGLTDPRIVQRARAREFLEGQGISFPEGAFAQYVAAGSRLIVRNTTDNLDLIDYLVEAVGQQNTQVEIETKFIEVTQSNLDELGFDWLLGPVRINRIADRTFSGGELGYNDGGTRVYNQYPVAGTVDALNNRSLLPVTDGIRSGMSTAPNAAITGSGLDALIAGIAPGASTTAPGVLGLSGILNSGQFQVVMRALNQKKGVDLMSAPRVTTQSGKKAVVRVVREFPYPTEFNPPEIPQDTTGGGTARTNNNVVSLLSAFSIVSSTNPVTPTTPVKFETRNVGVTLEVEPTVSADNYTIELNLAPEVVEFDGFINYGSPIMGPTFVPIFLIDTITYLVPTRIIDEENSYIGEFAITPNVINQPIFSVRKVRTNVSVWDGQTVVLGGLIREDIQKANDKVPIFGDVPLLGHLFRGNAEQKIKRNLMMFVTTRILDAEGRPIRQDLDVEEQFEPIGLPPDRMVPTTTSARRRLGK